ncbi:MAG: hypothetical protein OXD47_09105, partial [Gammaproteobacteria bacterium]|nr:hypothetical protein [Gammaproteobacteria bacterium]
CLKMTEMKNHTFSFPSLKMPRRAFLEVPIGMQRMEIDRSGGGMRQAYYGPAMKPIAFCCSIGPPPTEFSIISSA